MWIHRWLLPGAVSLLLSACATTPTPAPCSTGSCVVTISKSSLSSRLFVTPDRLVFSTGSAIEIRWRFQEGAGYSFDSAPEGRPQDRVVFQRFDSGEPTDFPYCFPVADERSKVPVQKGPVYLCAIRAHAAALAVTYGIRFSDGMTQYRVDPTIQSTSGLVRAPRQPGAIDNKREFRRSVCGDPSCPLKLDAGASTVQPDFLQIPFRSDPTVLVWAAPKDGFFDPDPLQGSADGILFSPDGTSWNLGYVPDAVIKCYATVEAAGTGAPASSVAPFFRCEIRKDAGNFADFFYSLSYRDSMGQQRSVEGKVGRSP